VAAARELARQIYLNRWHSSALVAPLQAAARLAEDARFADGPVVAAARVFYRLAAQSSAHPGLCTRLLALATPPDACGPDREGRPVSR
jgi:hypothetical protein